MARLSTLKRLKLNFAPNKVSWIDPDTQREFNAATRPELIQKIVNYRAQNNLETIENLNLVLENYWCSLPENCDLCEEVKLERGWMTYLKGAFTLVKTIAYGEYATQEEADRRSDICVSCPHNINPDKTNWQNWADEITEHAIGDRKSKNHDKLFNCEVCSCVMKSKVWYADKIELTKEELIQMPDFCWQKQEAVE